MDLSADSIEKLGIVGTLVALGGGIVRFLLGERKGLIADLVTANERDRELRDKRTDELLEQAKMMAVANTVIRDALQEVKNASLATESALEELKAAVESVRRRDA